MLCGLVGHLHGMHTVAFMAAEVGNITFLFSFTSVEKMVNPLGIKYNLCLSLPQCLLVTVRTGHVITR